jgi:PH (Pleckstrin Homology) domain-containing protein
VERTYRNVTYPILGVIAVAVLMTGGLLGAIAPHHATTVRRVLTAAVPFAVSVLISRSHVRAKLSAREDGLTVCNPFRTLEIAWNDVEAFDMVTAILRIRLNTGEIVRVWAVQPAGIRHVMSRGSRADTILDELGSMLSAARDPAG